VQPDNPGPTGAGDSDAALAARSRPRDLSEVRTEIIEIDDQIPREWGDGLARLHPDRALGDVPLKRWQRFVDDVALFLDGRWAEKAAALGWGPLDLFGCDRDRPCARIDQAGLLWQLDGNRLVALSENTATIETRTGARQTWRHSAVSPAGCWRGNSHELSVVRSALPSPPQW
jgi:hypothetical protein